MGIFESALSFIDPFLYKVLVPFLVLCGLILIHEYGHFIVAKLCGVGVVRFSVGFGPAIYKWSRKETEYRIGWIPLGGYVRMVGDMPDAITGGDLSEEEQQELHSSPELNEMLRDRSYWFLEKSLWARSAIVVAGPLFNFILAVVLVALSVALYGRAEHDKSAKLGAVLEHTPAADAGLKSGDVILSVSGQSISGWEDLATSIHNGNGKPILVEFEREGSVDSVNVTPKKRTITSASGDKKEVFLIGIRPNTTRANAGFFGSWLVGLEWTSWMTSQTYQGLWGMISGKVSAEDLAGPLFILDAAGDHAQRGLEDLLYFMATLSVSLAVLNLLPIPVLDGGHLLFFLIEALIGPISIRKKEFAQSVGVLVLLGLMVFAIHNDISRDSSTLGSGWSEEE